ncbi:MAG: protein kinase [Sandaracinaceae bacterium]|nr:protein kinase [Sandaracinaceae bacterium]
MDPKAAPVVYGKYQLLELLARGGMAEVFKAKSHGVEGFEKILVIKRILPELSRHPQFVEMFINEAKIAVTLSHANIVQVFDLGRFEDTYFIAMEYVAGLDLATVLRLGRRYNRPMSRELVVYVMSELAKALDYAHRRRDAAMRPLNIVHCDVSPQNVLLSWEGEVKLTDFGIAKARTSVEEDGEPGMLKGKYSYMAPEQAEGIALDARADLFSLGTMLYEALTGANPFVADSAYETLQRVRSGDLQPIQERLPDLAQELVSIVRSAMATDPNERPANAGRMYEELIQFLYASGRRVGASDLTEYLGELRAATEAAVGAMDGADALLRAAFEEPSSSTLSRAPEPTPSEIPSGRVVARRSLISGILRNSLTPVRPSAESHDVTVLVASARREHARELGPAERVIHRFGGTISQNAFDAGDDEVLITALFGIREPDGRDTDTAARCALQIARAARNETAADDPKSHVRIGLHAGRVYVDLDGNPLPDERASSLVQLARDLADASDDGKITVSAPTEKLLRARFHLESTDLNMRDTSVVVAERDASEAYGKFVGRREELKRIGEEFAIANRNQQRIFLITGEAGAGKSRLVHETLRRLKLGGHDAGVYFAVCAAHEANVPYAATHEMLRVVLGIDESDSDAIAREKVGRARELGLSTEELDAVRIVLGLGNDGDRVQIGQSLHTAVLRMSTRLAKDRLSVFVWDAADAMDPDTQKLLEGLMRARGGARIAVLLAGRPGFQHPWANLPNFSQHTLGPLSDDDVARLTAVRLRAEEVFVELLQEMRLKSGGNPLYVEEYLKTLAASGAVEVVEGRVVYRREVAEIEVPKSLRGIVASRLARLETTERHVLQVAAIIGTRFNADLVACVTGQELATTGKSFQALVRKQLFVALGPSEYGFSNDLVGEVLRDSLSVDGKREMHRSVASALEELHPQRLDELADTLAHHWREAGDRVRAIDYLERAATRMEGENAFGSAIRNLGAAISMLGQLATPDRDRMLFLYRRLGDLAFRGRDLEEGAKHLAAAIEIAETLGRESDIARFSIMRGRLLINALKFEEGRHWLDRGRDIARRLNDRALLRDGALAAAEADSRNGEHVRAVAAFKEALEVSRELGDLPAQIRCLIPLSLAFASSGDSAAAFRTLGEARDLAKLAPDRFTDCELLKFESLLCFYAEDHERSIECAQKALDLAKEYGFDYECAVNAHNIGEAYLRLADFKRAFASLRYSYELARERGYEKLEIMNLRVLGYIDASKFGSSEGRARIVEAIQYASDHGYVWDLIEGKLMLAIVDEKLGEREEARRLLREVLRLATDNGHSRSAQEAERAIAALDRGEPIPAPQ